MSVADDYTDEDMANVGRSLMESLHSNCPKWMPADDPAEIVVDLLNTIHDLKEALKPFAGIGLAQDGDKRAPDMIDGPDLCITPKNVRDARRALSLNV